MIPLHLRISGFLSYRDPVELDFSSFELACISGQNGAGKSSLLDAMTWVLFGEARGKSADVINLNLDVKAAEVALTFAYEGNTFRVQRTLPRGKSTVLEFQILDGGQKTEDGTVNSPSSSVPQWRPLTEKTTRDTQARIEQTLRLDYDTFINASFFLQGKADEFTQRKSSERKAVLSTILGLEIWDMYKDRATERRKLLEREVSDIEIRLAELEEELGQEQSRKKRLAELEAELVRLKESHKTQEAVMETIKQAIKTLEKQRETVEKLNTQVLRGTNILDSLITRKTERESERNRYFQVVADAENIEKSYANWQTARVELEKWNSLAEKFNDHEKERQKILSKLRAEQARLEQERDGLQQRENQILEKQSGLKKLESEAESVKNVLEELETNLKARTKLEHLQIAITRFREQSKLRQAPLTEIHSEMVRLEQEAKTLIKQQEVVEIQQLALNKLQAELDEAQGQINISEIKITSRNSLEQEVKARKESQFEIKSINERLKLEMETLDERIKKLAETEGAVCPLCGQPISFEERKKLIDNLHYEGKSKGDEFRKNKSELDNLGRKIVSLEKEISSYGRVEKDHLFYSTLVAKIGERIKANQQTISDWETTDAPHLLEIQYSLKEENYSPSARKKLSQIDRELETIGKSLKVKVSLGKSIFDLVEEKVLEIEDKINALKDLEEERIKQNTHVTRLNEQIKSIYATIDDWNKNELPRKLEVSSMLKNGSFAMADHTKLAKLDTHLKSLGYDATAHETVRQSERIGRVTEKSLRELESARAVLTPLEREIADLQNQIQTQNTELATLKSETKSAQKTLNELNDITPNIREAERTLFKLREQENIKNQEVGAARQKVDILSTLRTRKTDYSTQTEELNQQIVRHKTLERAFGKDGVPALLIEQALPQIEQKANDLLDRLSDGHMSIRFVTQAEYKDKKRDDLKETLDIQISDSAGLRNYEMYSGGEAFRVNFAIRLALSEILSQRKGARLQTLVIDEGFGSQDAQGRQRLIEAINLVKHDFAKILIITHLDELKDAFPNRIEVEKTERGSTVKVT